MLLLHKLVNCIVVGKTKEQSSGIRGSTVCEFKHTRCANKETYISEEKGSDYRVGETG